MFITYLFFRLDLAATDVTSSMNRLMRTFRFIGFKLASPGSSLGLRQGAEVVGDLDQSCSTTPSWDHTSSSSSNNSNNSDNNGSSKSIPGLSEEDTESKKVSSGRKNRPTESLIYGHTGWVFLNANSERHLCTKRPVFPTQYTCRECFI